MTLEEFQSFTNFRYALAKAQAQAEQGQYPVPHMATLAQLPAQLVVKLPSWSRKQDS